MEGGGYRKYRALINAKLYRRIKANPLFVRTLDTGALDGRAGLYLISEKFGVDGIAVTSSPYRTHPVQVFLEPALSMEDVLLLRDYFNLMLEHFRAITDSEFLTTYKYSESAYTRKYLGLSQVKSLIETFPILGLPPLWRRSFETLVQRRNAEGVIGLLESLKKQEGLSL